MKQVVQNGDSARWHTDILWVEVLWQITSSSKVNVNWVSVSLNWDIVHFASHPHAINLWVPIDYRTHDVAVVWTWKLSIWVNCALDWDIVPVSDIAWPDATMKATQFKLYSN